MIPQHLLKPLHSLSRSGEGSIMENQDRTYVQSFENESSFLDHIHGV